MIPIIFLLWSANVEPDLSGYRVSWGTLPGQYQYYIETRDTTAVAQPGRYYAVQAFDVARNYSLFSEEVYAMPDSISAEDTLRFRIEFSPRCALQDSLLSVFWKPASETWAGKWNQLVGGEWGIVKQGLGIFEVEIRMPELAVYLDRTMKWDIQFSFHYDDASIESEIFLLANPPCKPVKLERISP